MERKSYKSCLGPALFLVDFWVCGFPKMNSKSVLVFFLQTAGSLFRGWQVQDDVQVVGGMQYTCVSPICSPWGLVQHRLNIQPFSTLSFYCQDLHLLNTPYIIFRVEYEFKMFCKLVYKRYSNYRVRDCIFPYSYFAALLLYFIIHRGYAQEKKTWEARDWTRGERELKASARRKRELVGKRECWLNWK